MKKPERVEVGQWWAWCNQRGPKRIETIRTYSGRLEAEYGDGHGSVVCQWLLDNGEYLGSGEHPEPSEWMIETLAALSARMIEEERGGDPPGSFYLSADEEQRESVRGTIRWYLDDKSVNHWAYPNHARATKACIREVYHILRSLGKW